MKTEKEIRAKIKYYEDSKKHIEEGEDWHLNRTGEEPNPDHDLWDSIGDNIALLRWVLGELE